MKSLKPVPEGPIRLLHVYGQGAWHDNIEIVGNSEALLALADTIQLALMDRNSEMESFVSDGEGFSVRVSLYDKPWLEWNALPMPYTDEVAKERRDWAEVLGPYKIWDYNEAMNRKENANWWQRLLKKMARLSRR
jgi:hypothetical protein